MEVNDLITVPADIIVEISKWIDNSRTLDLWKRMYSKTCSEERHSSAMFKIMEEMKKKESVFENVRYRCVLHQKRGFRIYKCTLKQISGTDKKLSYRKQLTYKKMKNDDDLLPEQFAFLFLLSDNDLCEDDLLTGRFVEGKQLFYLLELHENCAGKRDGRFQLYMPGVNSKYGHMHSNVRICGTLVDNKVHGQVFICISRKLHTILYCNKGKVSEYTFLYRAEGFKHDKWPGKEITPPEHYPISSSLRHDLFHWMDD
jgi:hypothetical protein